MASKLETAINAALCSYDQEYLELLKKVTSGKHPSLKKDFSPLDIHNFESGKQHIRRYLAQDSKRIRTIFTELEQASSRGVYCGQSISAAVQERARMILYALHAGFPYLE